MKLKIYEFIQLCIQKNKDDYLQRFYYSGEEVIEGIKERGEVFWYITNWRYKNKVQFVKIISYSREKGTVLVENKSQIKDIDSKFISNVENKISIKEGNTFRVLIKNRFIKEDIISKMDQEIEVPYGLI